MIKYKQVLRFVPLYIVLLLVIIWGARYADRAILTTAKMTENANQRTIIIDAGHGGIDGGATSCTGVLESHVNLEIALRLNDLFRLMGFKTVMIRTEDVSIHTEGESVAARKISDLKERVRIINSTPNAILISIHQNYYPSSQYSGAQVFYAKTEHSMDFSKKLQDDLIQYLHTNKNRQEKKTSGIYLMEHVNCPAVLVECGFLSNPQEEALLRSEQYQKLLCSVIVSSTGKYWNQNNNAA